jgi:hypothetical protein
MISRARGAHMRCKVSIRSLRASYVRVMIKLAEFGKRVWSPIWRLKPQHMSSRRFT